MLTAPGILAKTALALNLGKARFVLVMRNLVASHSDLVALVAHNRFVGANFSMGWQLRLVDRFSAMVGAWDFCRLAVRLNMWLELVD